MVKCDFYAVDDIGPLVVVCAHDTRRHVSPQPCFSGSNSREMFWHLLPGPVIGGQVCRVPPISTAEREENKAF